MQRTVVLLFLLVAALARKNAADGRSVAVGKGKEKAEKKDEAAEKERDA